MFFIDFGLDPLRDGLLLTTVEYTVLAHNVSRH